MGANLYLSGDIAEQFKVWPLDQPSMTIGRSSRNAIQIADPTVSKEHAEVLRRGDRYLVRDLGSRNGTRVNGAEARDAVELKPGDRLEVGHVPLRVTADEPSHEVRFSDQTVVGSSMRVRVDQVLERRSRSAESAGTMVQLLAEAGHLLVLPRPLRETCDEILKLVEKAVPASRYILLMRDGADSSLVQMAGRFSGGGADKPLAMSRSIVQTVLDECTAVLTADAALDPRFQGQESIVAQSVHSAMAVPLFDNENVLGLIYVDSRDLTVRFNEDQLEVLTLLANMAAVKISNARLLEAEQARARLAQELASATRIQRGLLQTEVPELAGYEIDAFLETCYEVGGDLYDLRVRGDGRLLFVIGDVSGKGMGAALLMSSFLASARVLYETCTDPGELARRLSTILSQSTDPRNFITGIIGCLTPDTGQVHYVNAGHPEVCLVSQGKIRTLEGKGVPFGVVPNFPYQSESFTLEPGELLAVFSDGLPEAQRGEDFFDDERLQQAIAAAAAAPTLAEVRSGVLERLNAFLSGAPRTDDVTLVMIRRKA